MMKSSKIPEDVQNILAEYGIKGLALERFKKVIRIESAKGTKGLKAFSLPEEALDFVESADSHLAGNGYPVQRINRTLSGKLSVQYGDKRYILFDWIDGNTYENPGRKQKILIGSSLARFHLSGSGFNPPSIPGGRNHLCEKEALLKKRIGDLERFDGSTTSGHSSSFERQYKKSLPFFLRDAYLALSYIGKPEAESVYSRYREVGSLCHGDPWYKNVVFAGGTDPVFIDLEHCTLDIPAEDLAHLISREGTRYGWSLDRILPILEGYLGINPLSPEELSITVALLLWPQAFWRIGSQFFDERLDWSKRRFKEKLWLAANEYKAKLKCIGQLARQLGIDASLAKDLDSLA